MPYNWSKLSSKQIHATYFPFYMSREVKNKTWAYKAWWQAPDSSFTGDNYHWPVSLKRVFNPNPLPEGVYKNG